MHSLYGKAFGRGGNKDSVKALLEERFGTSSGNEIAGKGDRMKFAQL